MAIARAANAVPRRARLVMLRYFILASSHRNDGDIVAASDADYWTSRHSCAARLTAQRLTQALAEAGHRLRDLVGLAGLAGRDRAALEARHIAARAEGRVRIQR